MSNKPAPRCPGCGAEMELMELERNTWRYSCEDCGWRSPAVHGPGKEGKDAAYDKAMKRYAENPWISVKDRLPEEKVDCIVHYKHAYCDTDDYWAIGLCFYDGEKFKFDPAYKVTHWMPLPEHPKEE